LTERTQNKGQSKKPEDEISRSIQCLRTEGVSGKFGLRAGKPQAPKYGNDPSGTRSFG
jgi:hypothetical protein